MKAIVLAGGHATRLWPLTRNRAKPLLPLAGRPIIQYVLDDLQELQLDETIISTNAKYADDFQDMVDRAGYSDVTVMVEEHESEENKVGSIGAMMQVTAEKGDDDYLVVGGDNYTSLDLEQFAAAARERDAVTNACFELAETEDASQFGVVGTGEEDRITAFEEKPEDPPSRLISTLFYYFPEHRVDLLDEYAAAHDDEDAFDSPGQLIEWGHSREAMYAYPFRGDWFDIGTPGNYLDAQMELGAKQVDGAVSDSELGANVWVMDGAEVRSSRLEDCIVFPGAEISDSSLERSIVDREACVDGMELDEAVIGEFSRIT